MIPVIGVGFDAANAIMYYQDGDYLNMSLSAASTVCGIGEFKAICNGGEAVFKGLNIGKTIDNLKGGFNFGGDTLVLLGVGALAYEEVVVSAGEFTFNKVLTKGIGSLFSSSSDNGGNGHTKKYVPNTGTWIPLNKTRGQWLKENGYTLGDDYFRGREEQNRIYQDILDKDGNIIGRMDRNDRVNGKVVPDHVHLKKDSQNIHYWFNDK